MIKLCYALGDVNGFHALNIIIVSVFYCGGERG